MPTTSRARESGRVRLLAVLVVIVVTTAATVLLVRLGVGPLPDPEVCTAEVGQVSAEITLEQAENASLIAAIAVRRGMPARAASIALATAFQESKLRNISYGDRDSVGLFQQRPSQGWGTRDQLLDPVFAVNAFYDALEKVDGYQEMPITEAAQEVQRSGYPEAYGEHEAGARALASALTGYSPARFTCVVDRADADARGPGASGLTPRADRVREDVESVFGDLVLGGFSPEGVTSGHMKGSTHYEGRAIDVFVRPVDEANRRRGWAIAHYLVANADRLGVQYVIFDARIWGSGGSSEDGWRPYTPSDAEGASPATRAVLEHRDHVHVDVVGDD